MVNLGRKPHGHKLMSHSLVLVLTAPSDRDISFLSEFHQMATTVVGDSAEDLAGVTDNADIISTGRARRVEVQLCSLVAQSVERYRRTSFGGRSSGS